MPSSHQWRDAANVLREQAAHFDVLAEEQARREGICAVVCPNAGPKGEPLACAWPPDHLPTPHSWASLPTVVNQ